MNIKEEDIVYEKDGFELAIKNINNGDKLIEIEETEEINTIEKLIQKVNEIGIPIYTDNYFVKKAEIELEYSNNATWNLPNNIYMDRDHDIIILVNDIQISKLYYTINKSAKIFTINTNKITINSDTKVKIIYYQDIIEKSYMVEQDCEVFVKPIIIDSYHYGQHNIIGKIRRTFSTIKTTRRYKS